MRTAKIAAAVALVAASAMLTASSPATTTERRVAVLMVNFSNNTRTPWTASQVGAEFFGAGRSVATFYERASYSTETTTGQVFGWWTLAATDETCDLTTWAAQARARAASEGVDLTTYDHVVYVFPQPPPPRQKVCLWAGLATSATESWLNPFSIDANFAVTAAHELGHNRGWGHGDFYNCGPVTISLSGCTIENGGDRASVMGYAVNGAMPLPHARQRAKLGWAVDEQTVGLGEWTITPLEGPNPSSLRIPRPSEQGDSALLLEYRQPSAPFDTQGGVIAALALGPAATMLLDATPGWHHDVASVAMQIGGSFFDPWSSWWVTLVSQTPTSATIRVSTTAPPTTTTTAPPTTTTTCAKKRCR